VEELFEARRMPKGEAIISQIAGVVRVMQFDRYSDQRIVRVEHSEMISDEYDIPEGWSVTARDETTISSSDPIATLGDAHHRPARRAGARGRGQGLRLYEQRDSANSEIANTARLLIKDDEHIQLLVPR